MDEALGLTATEITVNVKNPTQKVHWFLAGDAHIGNISFDKKSFESLRKNILLAARNSPVIITFMGDVFDSIILGDKRYSPAEQNTSKTSSNIYFYEWLKPLMSNKNIIFNGFLLGNHEMTLAKKGVNSAQEVEDKTGGRIKPYGCVTHNIIILKCNKKVGKLRSFLTHRSSNKKTQVALESYAKECYLQVKKDTNLARVRVVASGHTHDLSYTTCKVSIPQPECKKILHDTIHVCRTGSFLKQDYDSPSYATEAGHFGKPMGYIEVVFSMKCAKGEGDNIRVHERFNGDIDPNATFKLSGEI